MRILISFSCFPDFQSRVEGSRKCRYWLETFSNSVSCVYSIHFEHVLFMSEQAYKI